DRFRGRIMFPIADVSGRIIGFSGRIFEAEAAEGGSPGAPSSGASRNDQYKAAKYLNSPETDVFDKSRVLHGIDRARDGIRALGAAILVEGQFDLLMAHQAGYKNAVATSGTALTERHVELLKRYTPNLLVAYDGDRAGIAAAGRAAAAALRAGMNVKIAKLPPGADPADLIKDDLELFKETVKDALHVVDFYLAHIADAKYDARTFRLEVSRTVLPYVAMIQNRIDQAHFVKRVAEVLGVPEEAVAEEVQKAQNAQRATDSPIESGAPRSMLYDVRSEPFLSRGDTIKRLLFGLMLLFKERGDTKLSQSAETALRQALSEGEFTALSEGDTKRIALFEADFFLERYPEPEKLSEVMNELFDTLKRESLHEHYRETLSALRVAEVAHDHKKTEELMQKLSTLASNLR
ncbi:MAG: toprim domain-containing protein, partial [bacterium]|nr:toprim domain-containing protein [bacterium]